MLLVFLLCGTSRSVVCLVLGLISLFCISFVISFSLHLPLLSFNLRADSDVQFAEGLRGT